MIYQSFFARVQKIHCHHIKIKLYTFIIRYCLEIIQLTIKRLFLHLLISIIHYYL